VQFEAKITRWFRRKTQELIYWKIKIIWQITSNYLII